jgi:hypothetical protein
MKDKIEHKFKELLENQEFPYDSAAWDSMSKLLDQKMPVSKPTNFYRWLLGGAAITAIAISTYFLVNSYKQTNDPIKISTDVKTDNKEKTNSVKEENKENTDVQKQKEVEINESNVPSDGFIGNNQDPILANQDANSSYLVQEKQIQKNQSIEQVIENVQDKVLVDENKVLIENNEIKPEIHAVVCKNVCIGEEQVFENKNEYKLFVINQNLGQTVATIPSKSKISFVPKTIGNYVIKSNSAVISSFDVKSGNKPSLEIESTIIYIKGVPTIKASTNVENGITWTINNKTLGSVNNEIEFNPFKSGNYTVTVSSQENGCAIENSQGLQISEDYNLLAVNAFEPTSFEPKRQTFIPFALTQREVKFTMIILDPRDGGLVYKTSDASTPWNGTDMRSGQLVKSGQDFIWKVQLVNPLPGESSEYKGIITKL